MHFLCTNTESRRKTGLIYLTSELGESLNPINIIPTTMIMITGVILYTSTMDIQFCKTSISIFRLNSRRPKKTKTIYIGTSSGYFLVEP